MIRGSEGTGPFNTDFSVKLVIGIAAILIVAYEYGRNKKRYFVGLLTTGTIMWSCAELILQLTGIREFKPAYIFGWVVPFWIQIPLQGLVEGAFIAIFCMFFGDRIWGNGNKITRRWAILVFSILMGLMVLSSFRNGVQVPNYGGDVPSRREMFGLLSTIFLGVLVGIDILFFKRADPEFKRRGYALTILMTIFGTLWTLGEWAAGTRWIEMGGDGVYYHAPPVVEFLALSYDVIVEITLAYVPFLAIPYFTHYRKAGM